MYFKPNITPVEIIKIGAFGRTFGGDIYSGENDKFYKNSWKEFKKLESIGKRYYSSNFMMSMSMWCKM